MTPDEKAEFDLWLGEHGLPLLSPAKLLGSKTIRLDPYQRRLIARIAADTGSVVLLFSNVARADLAARLHAPSCSMVNTSKGRRGCVTRIDDPTEEDIADLNERGWPVKRCKCLPTDPQSGRLDVDDGDGDGGEGSS